MALMSFQLVGKLGLKYRKQGKQNLDVAEVDVGYKLLYANELFFRDFRKRFGMHS